MANLAKWTTPSSWTAAFNTADLASMAHGNSVMSSVADIANGTNLDVYLDVSMALAITSTTPTAGDFVAFYIAYLNQDGSTYGDGSFPSGTQKAWLPSWQNVAAIPLQTGAGALTSLVGMQTGIIIAPGSFRLVCALSTASIALSSGTQTVKYRTYEMNLNA